MILSNDRLFCLLFSAEDCISIGRLNCYTYMFQRLGLSLDYQFRVNVSGVRSKSFSRYLEEQVSLGIVNQNNGNIEVPRDSQMMLSNFILSFEELVIFDNVKNILSGLSDSELYFVCIVDIIIEDVIKAKGVDGLVTSRNFIECSVKNLCSEYSEENFNSAISLLRLLKKEYMFNE